MTQATAHTGFTAPCADENIFRIGIPVTPIG